MLENFRHDIFVLRPYRMIWKYIKENLQLTKKSLTGDSEGGEGD